MSLPDWPRLMKIELARSYLDMSETKFRELVKQGALPQGFEDGSNVKWDRQDLDSYVEGLRRKAHSVNRKEPEFSL